MNVCIYCGNELELPYGYDAFGTVYQCLRKGYGAALGTISNAKLYAARRAEKTPRQPSLVFCGHETNRPADVRPGTRYECLRKGYGRAMYTAPYDKIYRARLGHGAREPCPRPKPNFEQIDGQRK
jgi:hypothetical protein